MEMMIILIQNGLSGGLVAGVGRNSILYHTPVDKSKTSLFLGSSLFSKKSYVYITEN